MNHHSHEADRRLLEASADIFASPNPMPFNASSPPIFQTSLFTFDTYAEIAEVFAGRSRQYIYSRGDNPTVAEFEQLVAALEGAEAARGFSSGTAAIAAAVLAFVGAGDRIVAVNHLYSDAFRLFQTLLVKFGVAIDYVDGADPAAVEAKLPGAKLLYLENPTSMVFGVQDIEALATMARHHGAISVIDNSWATPLFQKPVRHGVDLVVHAASKYLGGHSDTVAGVVAGSKAHLQRINTSTYPYLGAKLSPFEAWLLLRGMRTLPLRMQRHMASGLDLAAALNGHGEVERVNHPAFSHHPGKASLTGFSGLFSFDLSDAIDVPRFVDSLRRIRLGVSWGGPESLVVPSLAALLLPPEANSFRRFGVGPRTIRFAVGLEEPDLLWADIEQAIEAARH